MRRRDIRFSLCIKNENRGPITQDWAKFELIMFNLIQNAIKYNNSKGEVILVMDVRRVKKELGGEMRRMDKLLHKTTSSGFQSKVQMDPTFKHVLVVKVVDTGIGISTRNQEYLFVPFKELY